MHLYIPTMDAVLVEFARDGRVRLKTAALEDTPEMPPEVWSRPTLQEIRAIIHAAEIEIEELTELIDTLQDSGIRT
jgi:hypothetical protein